MHYGVTVVAYKYSTFTACSITYSSSQTVSYAYTCINVAVCDCLVLVAVVFKISRLVVFVVFRCVVIASEITIIIKVKP